MPINILMPALSPTMTEGNLARWVKKEGDAVKPGMVLAEIETDKATMEVEAVDEGKLAKILVPAGTQGVKVNQLIAVLLEDGEADLPANYSAAPAAPKAESKPSPANTSAPAPAMATVASTPAASSGGRIVASPLAKRIAEQNNIDLRRVSGTGPAGRIVKEDVEKAMAGGGAPAQAAAPQGMDAIDYANKLGMAYDLVPNSTVRKVIAKRLTEAKQTVPHFYLTVDCKIDRLLELRKQLNETTDAKVSVNDFIIKAVAVGLKHVPATNASWAEAGILLYKDIDVSIAVATPNGLVTPIIKKADQKSIQQVSSEMKDLAARARDNKLKPQEFQGGGFTISNLGMFGIKEFAAIINPPQGCILAVGAGEPRPIVNKDGELAVATVMSCTLSVDHRVVDGAIGAEFLTTFRKLIEEPLRLFV
jgi:pyruvate dehydrogenase E2 component (dihydrolipoamide acetyltransferase)